MAINFPSSPANGDTYTAINGIQYIYDAVKNQWKSIGEYTTGAIEALKLDNIASGFNGSATTFNLTSNSSTVKPHNAQSILIAINGALKAPDVDYTVSRTAGTITFTSAPTNGQSFMGVVYSRLPIETATHLAVAGGTMTGDITFNSGQTFPAAGVQDASTTQEGVVQLSNSISSTSETLAATAKAVKDAKDTIITLVDDVGGFVPIANETSFPNANPDPNDDAGTLVSIMALASNLVSNGSGVATITNGTVGNSTVTITGLANSTTYAAGFGMIVETTSTLNTYTFHRQLAKATEVSTVAGIASNVTTVAGNNTNINTVAGISSNVTTVAGITSNIGTVAGIASDITAVAGDATDIGLVAGKATEIGRLGTSAAIADLNILGTAEVVSDLDACATNITNINAVGSNASNINAVAGELLFSEDLGSITAALTTGSGNNINTVASNITDVNTFANVYRIAASAPSSSLDEGDLWYDSTSNKLKYYNGSAWTVTAAAGLSAVADDTSPELAGHLDCNDKNLTEVGTVSGDNLQIDFGTLS